MDADVVLQDERIRHIRKLNENLGKAESYMIDCKEALKAAREAYEAEVGKLRASIAELSSPSLPFTTQTSTPGPKKGK